MRRRLHPALVAAIAMAPVLVIQTVLVATGTWPVSPDLLVIAAIDLLFGLAILAAWHLAGRRR